VKYVVKFINVQFFLGSVWNLYKLCINIVVADEKKKIELNDLIGDLKDSRTEEQKKHSALCKTVDSACFEHDFDEIEEEYGEKQDELGGLKPINSGVLNRKLENLFKDITPANEDAQDEYDECMSNLEELSWKEGDKVVFDESAYDEQKVEMMSCEKEVKRLKAETKKMSVKKLEKQRGKLLKKLGVSDLDEVEEIDSVELGSKIGELHKQRVAVGDGDEATLALIGESIVGQSDVEEFDENDAEELAKLKGELTALSKISGSGSNGDVDSDTVSEIHKVLKKLGKSKKKKVYETVGVDDGEIVIKFGFESGDGCSRQVGTDHIQEMIAWIDEAAVSKQKSGLEEKIKELQISKDVTEARKEYDQVKKDVEGKKKNAEIDVEVKKLEEQMKLIAVVNDCKEVEAEIEKVGEVEKSYGEEKKQLIKLKKEMEKMETEKSIYENLAMIDDLKKEIKKLEENETVQVKIEDVKKEIEKNEQIIEFIELEKLYNKYVDAKDKLDEISELDEKIAGLDGDLKKAGIQLHGVVSTMGSLTAMIDELKEKKNHNEEKKKKIDEMDVEVSKVKEMISLLTTYKEMVKYDGVPNALIKKKKVDICKFVNEFISDFTDIVVDIIDDTVCVQKGGKWFHVGNLGGYEGWLISVAFKTALNRFSFYSKSAIMIIDEEVDCVDVINFDTKLPKIFNKLKQFYYCIFLVSHRNVSKLKDWDILIKNNGSYSVIDGIKSADET